MGKKRSLADFDAPEIVSNRFRIADIEVSSLNTRTYIDLKKLDLLAESMAENKQIAPVILRRSVGASKPYELIVGKRRFLCAVKYNLPDIEGKLLELSDRQACMLIREENENREAVNPIEDSLSILNLLKIDTGLETEEIKSLLYQMVNGKDVPSDFSKQVEQTFADLKSISLSTFVKDRLRLFNLPQEIYEAIAQGQLDYSKGILIARVKDEAKRNELLAKVLDSLLSKKQIQAEIQALKAKTVTIDYQEFTAEDLSSKIKGDYGRLSRSKNIWVNPKNRSKLEKIAHLIDQLLLSR